MRVLLVEDDADLREGLAALLRGSGLAVDVAAGEQDADVLLDSYDFDVAVIDRGLPDGDGLDLVRRRRRHGWAVPVVFLTARDTVADRVEGFEAGGDDYVVKPFAPEELVMRIRALARRRASTAPSRISIGGLSLDRGRREVQRDGVLLPLTAKEFAVLEVLMAAGGDVVSRRQLLDGCWDENADPASNVVDAVVVQLRRKLGAPSPVSTVRGAGFRVVDPA
jgi:DNA-binding response OmpR family regulator